jgi:hypothetical protein
MGMLDPNLHSMNLIRSTGIFAALGSKTLLICTYTKISFSGHSIKLKGLSSKKGVMKKKAPTLCS